MHAAVVADAIQQELNSYTAAETDVRGDRAARNLADSTAAAIARSFPRLSARATSGLKIP